MQEILQQHIKMYAHSDGSFDVEIGVHCTGIPTARGYNAPCFENVVHYYVGSVLMRWDNEDRKDRLSIALTIQNETKHFQVVSSNFQVQYWLAA